MALFSQIALVVAVLVFIVWWYCHIPFNLPKNIPHVPIYISLLGLWSDMGQDEIYEMWFREKMEKYGAVKIWFAGQWSVLVTRSTYLTEIFRNESNIYNKSGSQDKIPWSVITTLVGDNIINTTGDKHSLYVDVMKPGMQKRAWDFNRILPDTRQLINILLREQRNAPKGQGVLVNPWAQRWSMQIVGRNFLHTDFNCLADTNVRMEVLQGIIKKTVFKPLYFNFPDFDRLWFIIRSRKKAYDIMNEFSSSLCALGRSIPRRDVTKVSHADSTADLQLVDYLNAAVDEGRMTLKEYTDNLKIISITGHENAQQLINSSFYELGWNTETQDKLRAEVLATGADEPTQDLLNSMPYLTAVVYEMFRLYPPVNQLINRVAAQDAVLGGQIHIPKGTYIGWNARGCHTNPKHWGPDAKEFKPERWGATLQEQNAKFRRETVAGRYIPFNAHSRKCPGYGFGLLQIKIALFELMRTVKWTVDPRYKLKLTSGGILAPLGCKVFIEELPQPEKVKVPYSAPLIDLETSNATHFVMDGKDAKGPNEASEEVSVLSEKLALQQNVQEVLVAS